MNRQISLRLPESLTRTLDGRAKKEGIARSEVIRQILETNLGDKPTREGGYPFERIQDIIGSVRGGPPDLGKRHREYLRKRFRG